MSKRKKHILEAARNLFNEQGYSQVTIRMIALKLEISSGNLNYHYRKREDILEALYFEMVADFDNRVEALPKVVISLPQIRNDIKTSMQRMIEYQFFWTDLYNLLKLSEKIKEHFQKVYHARVQGYHYLFAALEKQQLFSASSFSKEHDLLIEQMINFSNTWIYAANLYGHDLNAQSIEYHANALLMILYPYLTNQGKEELRTLAPNFFMD